MTHVAFFITAGSLLLILLGSIIFILLSKNYIWTGPFTVIMFTLLLMGLVYIPLKAPSPDRVTLTPLDKNEYTAEKMCVGLLVTYDKYYAIIPEHKIVDSFNDSTEVILKEQTSYYKAPSSLRRYLEIDGKVYPLLEIYK
jgi:hypothetical protein